MYDGDYINIAKEISLLIRKDFLDIRKDKLFDLIKKNQILAEYFFYKLFKSNIILSEWFFLLKNENFFDFKNVPVPKKSGNGYIIPTWTALDYLEKLSIEIKSLPKQEREKYYPSILDIITDITQKAQKEEIKGIDKSLLKRNNFHVWRQFLEILVNIPNDKIPINIIKYIPFWLESDFGVITQSSVIVEKFLPKFLNNNKEDCKKAELILKYITTVKKSNVSKKQAHLFGTKSFPSFVIDDYYVKECFKNYAEQIGNKCSIDVIFTISENFINLFKQESVVLNSWDSVSEMTFDSISVEHILICGLRDILISKVKKDKESFNEIFDKFVEFFLEYQYSIFIRFLLFIIASSWDNLENKFWELIGEKNINPFRDVYPNQELFELLKKNAEKFDKTESMKLKELIEKCPDIKKKKLNNDENQQFVYRWKQKWYLALKNNKYLKDEYDTYKKKTNIDEEMLSPLNMAKKRFVNDKSHLSVDEILQISVDEFVEFLDVHKFDRIERSKLAGSLFSAVIKNPSYFVDNLYVFIKVDFIYIYHILWAFTELINKSKYFDISKLLFFLVDYLKQSDIWNNFIIKNKNIDKENHLSIIRQINEIILNLFNSKKVETFDKDTFSLLREILKSIITGLLKSNEQDEEVDSKEAVNNILNSTWGKTIRNFVFWIYEDISRNKRENQSVKWNSSDRDLYEEMLTENIKDAYTIFGYQMNDFFYFDKSWTKKKINEFKNIKVEFWKLFISGYLFFSNVPKEIYDLMYSHYEKAIETTLDDSTAEEYLCYHISLNYLRGNESLEQEKSLFYKMITKFKKNHILSIIQFFYQKRDFLLRKISSFKGKIKNDFIAKKERVNNFWKYLYDTNFVGRIKFSDDEKDILSELSKLVIYFDIIDSGNAEMFELSAKFAARKYNVPVFVEWLDKIKKPSNAEYIAKIYLNIVKNEPDYHIPSDMQTGIRSIVKFLKETGQEEIARQISNMFFQKGYYDLFSDLWDDLKNKRGNYDGSNF